MFSFTLCSRSALVRYVVWLGFLAISLCRAFHSLSRDWIFVVIPFMCVWVDEMMALRSDESVRSMSFTAGLSSLLLLARLLRSIIIVLNLAIRVLILLLLQILMLNIWNIIILLTILKIISVNL